MSGRSGRPQNRNSNSNDNYHFVTFPSIREREISKRNLSTLRSRPERNDLAFEYSEMLPVEIREEKYISELMSTSFMYLGLIEYYTGKQFNVEPNAEKIRNNIYSYALVYLESDFLDKYNKRNYVEEYEELLNDYVLDFLSEPLEQRAENDECVNIDIMTKNLMKQILKNLGKYFE